MLTLQDTPGGKFLCWIYKNNKRHQRVYWHPRRELKYRNAVPDLNIFNTEVLRDQFKVTRQQAGVIFAHIKNTTEPDDATRLQNKFFKIKKFVAEALYSEMDLSDEPDLKFVTDFPEKKKEWAGSEFVAGASSSGKTWYIKEKILRNLKGPPSHRRKFLFISNQFDLDDTLQELRKPKYSTWFSGIDVSDDSISSNMQENNLTAEQYFTQNIRNPIYDLPPSSVVLFDDLEDSLIKGPSFQLINRMLRTFRHRKVGVMYIIHRIKAGHLSSQGNQSVKYITTFPKSQKGKVLQLFLDQGMTKKEAARNLEDMKLAKGRHLSLRMWAPTCMISEEYLRLF